MKKRKGETTVEEEIARLGKKAHDFTLGPDIEESYRPSPDSRERSKAAMIEELKLLAEAPDRYLERQKKNSKKHKKEMGY